MNAADVIFPALSVFMAACTGSYLWIFFYRPAYFHSTPDLKALVWYRRLPSHVYLIFAMLGLGFMFVKGIETALWWAPRTWTVRMDGGDRPVVWLIAVGIGMFSAQFVMSKMEEIAPKISAAKDAE
jgi:hypothetical protein